MELKLQPTGRLVTVNNAPARIWEGVSDKGVKVSAVISSVVPNSHDAADHVAFKEELVAAGTLKRPAFESSVAIPLRMVL